jgi:hypothetical protein
MGYSVDAHHCSAKPGRAAKMSDKLQFVGSFITRSSEETRRPISHGNDKLKFVGQRRKCPTNFSLSGASSGDPLKKPDAQFHTATTN